MQNTGICSSVEALSSQGLWGSLLARDVGLHCSCFHKVVIVILGHHVWNISFSDILESCQDNSEIGSIIRKDLWSYDIIHVSNLGKLDVQPPQLASLQCFSFPIDVFVFTDIAIKGLWDDMHHTN